MSTRNTLSSNTTTVHAVISGLAICLMSVCLLLGIGCAAREFDDPVAAMSSRSLTQTEIINAMRQAQAQQPDNEERIKAMKAMITETGYTLAVRVEACTQLLEYNEEDARTLLRLRLPYMLTWDFIQYICQQAVDHTWTDFTSSLIRSLSRPAPVLQFNERPERTALLALHPGRNLQEIIFDYVRQPSPNAIEAEWRMKAWELLGQTGEITPLFDLLHHSTDSESAGADPFLDELRYAAAELGIIPITREEILWLQRLQKPEHADWWQQCKTALEPLSPEVRAEIRVRHLAVLVMIHQAHPEWLGMDREALARDIELRLTGRTYVPVNNTADDVLKLAERQKFPYWKEKLAWPDLLAVRLADEILSDDSVRQALMAEAETDREDTSTEHGGLLTLKQEDGGSVGRRPAVVVFSPLYRGNDHKFFTPDEMVEAGYTAPFHFHFHAQEPNNRQFAGPGLGDLEYAEAMGITGIVLTTVGSRALNMDYYQPTPRRLEVEHSDAVPNQPGLTVTFKEIQPHPVVIDLGTFELARRK